MLKSGDFKAAELAREARALFARHQHQINRRCDRMFAGLFVLQWAAGIVMACWLSPRTWAGSQSGVHPHVWAAVGLGSALISVPLVLIYWRPGGTVTRHAVAVAQMMTSALLIHLSGGRIETHFHIFGSLAFLAFYRDWRVLMTATAVVGVDHLVQGVVAPESIFGVAAASPWRVLEHVGWVLFEDYFLIGSCIQSRREMAEVAARQAENESAAEMARTDRDDLLTSLNAGTIVVMTDWTGRVSYVNDRVCAVTGYAREELLGQDPRMLRSAVHPEAFWAALSDATDHGGLWSGEICNRTKAGELYWVHANVKGLLGPDGFHRRTVSVQTDITAQKAAEMHRAQAAQLASIGQLAAGIAHEINTPTQYVGDNVRFAQDGFATLAKAMDACDAMLADGSPRPWSDRRADADRVRQALDLDFIRGEVPQAIAQALEGLERVTLIVSAMKDFSHPGSTNKEPADLNRAILSTVEVCRNRWKYVADLEADLAADLPPVPCLVAEFNQVVLNLIVNAADAIAETMGACGPADKGLIRVVSRPAADGRSVEVTVTDNGPGIPLNVQARLFEPFFTTKPLGKGTGQGLTLSRNVIVDKHGGSLTFRSTPGQGTTFTIRLPLDAAAGTVPLAA